MLGYPLLRAVTRRNGIRESSARKEEEVVLRRWRAFLLATVSACMLFAQGLVASAPASAASRSNFKIQHLQLRGTVTPRNVKRGGSWPSGVSEIPPHEPNSKTIRHTAASGVPSVSVNPVSTDQLPGFGGFNALSHLDQRNAGTDQYANSQFSLEPPDQGLCVGNGTIVEAVNNAMQVFDTQGNALTVPIALSQFFGLKPEVDRSDPNKPVYGDFISDPKCYYDPDTKRWFLTELQIDLDPLTAEFGKHSGLLVAVSQTADPTGSWSVYKLDTTDDGSNGTPFDPNCPCFGDQPLIGADANGFYVTTNEYSIASSAFNGAHVYALSKAGVESGTNSSVVHIDAGSLLSAYGGLAFSIQPATSPAASYETANNGTEYFLSAMDFGAAPALGTRANRLAVWALTNTASLNSANPAVTLSNVVINSELYAQPPNAEQKSGPTPLGDAAHSPLELIAANDDRLNQVVFAAGKLWAGLNTAVKQPNGATLVGIAYFVVTPSDSAGTLTATMTRQGYVAVNRANVLFPSIGVTDSGKAVIAFTLVGPDYYPSAAYAPLDLATGAGAVRIAGAGQLPDDGFSGYRVYGGDGVGRWGDYTAAVADASGTIWMAAEYIPNAPRSSLANWGTFISHVTP